MVVKDPNEVKDTVIQFRVEPSLRAEAQAIADEEYEGTLATVVRIALRKFVAERRAPVTTDTDLRAA